MRRISNKNRVRTRYNYVHCGISSDTEEGKHGPVGRSLPSFPPLPMDTRENVAVILVGGHAIKTKVIRKKLFSNDYDDNNN